MIDHNDFGTADGPGTADPGRESVLANVAALIALVAIVFVALLA